MREKRNKEKKDKWTVNEEENVLELQKRLERRKRNRRRGKVES